MVLVERERLDLAEVVAISEQELVVGLEPLAKEIVVEIKSATGLAVAEVEVVAVPVVLVLTQQYLVGATAALVEMV
jgi:threonine synthase